MYLTSQHWTPDFSASTRQFWSFPTRRFPAGLLPVFAAVALTTGCTTLSDRSPQQDVRAAVAARDAADLAIAHQSQEAIAARTAELLATPLTAQAAVELTLLNSATLRADLEAVGIADADRVQASLIRNPALYGSIRFPSESGAVNNTELGLTQNLLDVLVRPARVRVAEQEYQRAVQQVGESVIQLISDVTAAYFSAVGADQIAAMTANMAKAARVSGELASRFHDAGNVSLLNLALEQAASTEVELVQIRSQAESATARDRLHRLLGLPPGTPDFRLPDQLPALPTELPSIDVLHHQALERRLDLAAARTNVRLVDEALATTRRWRWTSGIEVGIDGERDTDGVRVIGPNLNIELPIFDQRQAAIARLEAQLRQSEQQVVQLERAIVSEVDEHHTRLRAQRTLAETYRERLIPLRSKIVQLSQLEQNYMLIGIFQVLLAKQQEYDTYRGYLEAVRDYWIAQTDLGRAIGGGLGLPTAQSPASGGSVPPEQTSQGNPSSTGHHHE